MQASKYTFWILYALTALVFIYPAAEWVLWVWPLLTAISWALLFTERRRGNLPAASNSAWLFNTLVIGLVLALLTIGALWLLFWLAPVNNPVKQAGLSGFFADLQKINMTPWKSYGLLANGLLENMSKIWLLLPVIPAVTLLFWPLKRAIQGAAALGYNIAPENCPAMWRWLAIAFAIILPLLVNWE